MIDYLINIRSTSNRSLSGQRMSYNRWNPLTLNYTHPTPSMFSKTSLRSVQTLSIIPTAHSQTRRLSLRKMKDCTPSNIFMRTNLLEARRMSYKLGGGPFQGIPTNEKRWCSGRAHFSQTGRLTIRLFATNSNSRASKSSTFSDYSIYSLPTDFKI